MKTALLWFRNDLRLDDHEPLHQALRVGRVIPVYCFDPRHFKKTPFGFPKTGSFRAQFLIESVQDLREQLQALGSDLVIRWGMPERVIPDLVKQWGCQAVYCHAETTSEELWVETQLQQALDPVKLIALWGSTLYHPEDLPFALARLPELFTHFRKDTEKNSSIRPVLQAPRQMAALPNVEPGALPSLTDLGIAAPTVDPRGVLTFKGGERAARARLDDYFWQKDQLRIYKETRNGMLGADYSSKFSPWLALGCLSPRRVYTEIQRYENERIRNDSTYWLVFELLWRDYFRFIAAKHGNRIFYPEGLQGIAIPWREDVDLFDQWQQGETGFPLVDANMRELKATGFMSNRGRQNVASFLTKNLGINWHWGAEWFESILIDYDVCSNWGNWNYTAGVGNDARGFRFFNILKQSNDYDPEGLYVKHWLPELRMLPKSKIHSPWNLLAVEEKRWGMRLGLDYPRPIVDLVQSAQANEALYNRACRGRRDGS